MEKIISKVARENERAAESDFEEEISESRAAYQLLQAKEAEAFKDLHRHEIRGA